MMSTGIPWGNSTRSPSPLNSTNTSIPRYTPPLESDKTRKRKREDKVAKPTSTKRVPIATKYKKTKTPRIYGQTLPVQRLIEVLDQKSLQNLLENLVSIHPEISATINNLSPKPSLKSSVELVKEKFSSIINHLPYKCDVGSDYSYLRIKPYLHEFMNCLSDFILSLLPPVETNIYNSVEFLQSVTSIVHDLPDFANSEFQYTISMAYEQIANAWHIVLSQRIQDESTEETTETKLEHSVELIDVIKKMNLELDLEKHDQVSRGKFKFVIDFVKNELYTFEQREQSLNNNNWNGSSLLNELITVDYTNFSISANSSN